MFDITQCVHENKCMFQIKTQKCVTTTSSILVVDTSLSLGKGKMIGIEVLNG